MLVTSKSEERVNPLVVKEKEFGGSLKVNLTSKLSCRINMPNDTHGNTPLNCVHWGIFYMAAGLT